MVMGYIVVFAGTYVCLRSSSVAEHSLGKEGATRMHP